ncbi:DUF456 family protein [Chamaesiphon sp. VAR_48_metabat_135_sub]|uniref:DUF456 domain-containing protein n=1 Tax=Chamaesiphon sp. VAR_48_metabat_135_sub TaxID=2964699 RepID=UPI00286CC962|nr:DUF456 family protein [Chamaesiphon sp. VAR_48_metabat_135_sub]
MTTTTLIYIALLLTTLVGVIGAVVPVVPGPSLILGASIVAGFLFDWDKVTITLIASSVVLVMCFAIEQFSGIWGAQKAGASHWGQIGSIVGLFLGFFGLLPALPLGGPLVGMFFGPFIGAVVGELLYPREVPMGERFNISFKAGIGIVLGSVIGLILQGLLSLFAAIVFAVTTWHLGLG